MQLKPKQPDTYDGKRDFQTIDNWIASVDSYFTLTKAEAPEIYHYLNTVFTGNAATWFRFHHRNLDPATITRNSVKTTLLAYFIPPNHTRRLRERYTRQTTTVNEYYTRLAQLAMQLGDITEPIFLDKFIRGLLKAKDQNGTRTPWSSDPCGSSTSCRPIWHNRVSSTALRSPTSAILPRRRSL